MSRILIGLISGLLFGLGLTVLHMIDPAKVIGFLNLADPHWDPTLALVPVSAVSVSAAGFALSRRWQALLSDKGFSQPGERGLDRRLVAGTVLFGVSWGAVGYCPGPALASLSVGDLAPLPFVAAVLAGVLLFNLLDRHLPVRARWGRDAGSSRYVVWRPGRLLPGANRRMTIAVPTARTGHSAPNRSAESWRLSRTREPCFPTLRHPGARFQSACPRSNRAMPPSPDH